MDTVQPGILLPVPEHCRYLTFGMVPGTDPSPALMKLRDHGIGEGMVVGIGMSVVSAMGHSVEGLRPFPSMIGPGIDVPATPAALWIWLRGDDPGKMVQTANMLKRILPPAS